MKTARLQVLTTPAFRDWLRKEASKAGISVGELVRTRCEQRVGDEEAALWHEVREFTPRFLAGNPGGGVVSVSTSLTSMCGAMEQLQVPVTARAGSGVFYAHYATNAPAMGLGGDSATMAKVKNMFDPENLLNPGRLYGII